jgi:hypothetical protein
MEKRICTDSAKMPAQTTILFRSVKFNNEEITVGGRKNQFYKIF